MTESLKPPASLTINQNINGGDAAHWQILTSTPNIDVPQWLQQALNDSHMPYGLTQKDQALPEDCWLIHGPNQIIQISQLIEVNAQQQPVHLLNAYPIVNSPYTFKAIINRIICCQDSKQAILNLLTSDGTSIYAFDNLYAVNKNYYQQDKIYNIELGGFAYELEPVNSGETIVVEDPAAIKHHRALNDILAQHNGIAPDNLQEQLAAWQPQTEDDKAPVTLDLSKMVAYLYGDTLGQEDEAWFQGEILGFSQTTFMDKLVDLLDVCIVREQGANPIVVRLAYIASPEHSFKVGDYVRGNIWLQATIY